MNKPINLIRDEIDRQNEKWGQQDHSDLYWLGIVGEEYGEIAKAIIEDSDPDEIREELVQLAAVCVQWIAVINRRKVKDGSQAAEE